MADIKVLLEQFEDISANPQKLMKEYLAGGGHGWQALIPQSLAEEFTVGEYAAAAHILASHAQRAVYVLRRVGAIAECGKRGRAKVYCTVPRE